MKNQVIKVESIEHGKRVEDYFKKKGVDTTNYPIDGVTEEGGFTCIYFGVINGSYQNYSLTEAREASAELITLPEEKKDIVYDLMCLGMDLESATSEEEKQNLFKKGQEMYDNVKEKPYPKMMRVWDKEEDKNRFEPIEIIAFHKGRYVGYDTDGEYYRFEYAEDIPEPIKVTKEEIAEWKGVDKDLIEIV